MISYKWSLAAVFFVSIIMTLSVKVTAAQDGCFSAGPIINTHEFRCVAALTIEKADHAPSEEQYATVRGVMAKASSLGFNTWRGFFNADEVRRVETLSPDDVDNLPAFGRAHGLAFIADTIDLAVLKLDDAGLRDYIKGLEKMGAVAFVVNDAHQYPVETLQTMVARVRDVSGLPLIASLRANSHVDSYKMFDYVEAQTFGTAEELSGFMALPFDMFCLDASTSLTVANLKQRGDIVLAARPKAFFYYTTRAADWLSMPAGEAATIKNIIEQWKS